MPLNSDTVKIVCVVGPTPPAIGGDAGNGGHASRGGRGGPGGDVIVSGPNPFLKSLENGDVNAFRFALIGGANGKNGRP